MIWGAIPGLLKVTTGAHEVIVTIMMNYLASLFAGWTVYAGEHKVKPWPTLGSDCEGNFRNTRCFESAQIPWLFGPPYRVHYGVFLALMLWSLSGG